MIDDLKTYVFLTPEGGWRVGGTRVSLDSIVHEYLDGEAPEVIAAHYPALTLEQVYGAITFYLANRSEIDAYLGSRDKLWDSAQGKSEANNAALLQRVRDARNKAANRSGQT